MCPKCNERLEDCECPPDFPQAFNPDDFYGDRWKIVKCCYCKLVDVAVDPELLDPEEVFCMDCERYLDIIDPEPEEYWQTHDSND